MCRSESGRPGKRASVRNRQKLFWIFSGFSCIFRGYALLAANNIYAPGVYCERQNEFLRKCQNMYCPGQQNGPPGLTEWQARGGPQRKIQRFFKIEKSNKQTEKILIQGNNSESGSVFLFPVTYGERSFVLHVGFPDNEIPGCG